MWFKVRDSEVTDILLNFADQLLRDRDRYQTSGNVNQHRTNVRLKPEPKLPPNVTQFNMNQIRPGLTRKPSCEAVIMPILSSID